VTLQESGEMYLEAIHVLSQKGRSVRKIDICEYLGYSKPSVTRAMGLLQKDGFVEISSEGSLALTVEGRRVAERIYERHVVLAELFKRLGVSSETASEDACRIEHYISEETFNAIKSHMMRYRAKNQ